MRRIILSVCVLLLILLVFSGCGSEASAPDDSDRPLLTITSNGETILPYQRFLWGDAKTDNGWISADAIQLVCELPDIAPKLPVVSYNDDFAVQYPEGRSYSIMTVYDESFKQLDDILFSQLPEGTYYVAIPVSKEGDYYWFENRYESSGYDCLFKLVIEQ